MIMSKSQETNWKMKGAIGKEEKRGEKTSSGGHMMGLSPGGVVGSHELANVGVQDKFEVGSASATFSQTVW